MNQKSCIDEPLLKERDPKLDETEEWPTVYKNMIKNAAICFFGTMLHPVYSMVNAVSLGQGEEVLPLAALGLGSLTLGICSLSINWTFATGSGIIIAQTYGQGEHRMSRVYANK